MSQQPSYTPTHGTLADRVVEWFKANPDEELTLQDVAHKFDEWQSDAFTALQDDRLLLTRSGPNRQRVYRLRVATDIAPAIAAGDLVFSISPDRCIAVSFTAPGSIDPRMVLAAMLTAAATTIGKQL